MNPFRIAFFVLVVLAWPGPVHFDTAKRHKAIDAAIHVAPKAWHVPGVAVVIVRDDEVMDLAGHGVRKVGEKDRGTPDTLFVLGSLKQG